MERWRDSQSAVFFAVSASLDTPLCLGPSVANREASVQSRCACKSTQSMGDPTDSAVVVFARLPRPGLVKTRLAASVGDEAAALFYKHCAEAVIGQLGRCWGAAAAAAAVCMQGFVSELPPLLHVVAGCWG